MSNNKFKLTGNVSKPTFHVDKNGKEFAIINMATNNSYTDKQGEVIDKPAIWHTLKVFFPIPLAVAHQLTEGSFITASGDIEYIIHEFEEDGSKRYVKEVSLMCTWINIISIK